MLKRKHSLNNKTESGVYCFLTFYLLLKMSHASKYCKIVLGHGDSSNYLMASFIENDNDDKMIPMSDK